MFEVPMPEGTIHVGLQVDAELGGDRDQVFRIIISDREDGRTAASPTRVIARRHEERRLQRLPRRRPGIRRAVCRRIRTASRRRRTRTRFPIRSTTLTTCPSTTSSWSRSSTSATTSSWSTTWSIRPRERGSNNAWNDLYASFDYHDNYLRLLAKHYNVDLKGKGIAQMDTAQIEALPAEMRKYVAAAAARVRQPCSRRRRPRVPRHVEDCLRVCRPRLAPSAHRKREAEPARFLRQDDERPRQDHAKAIRALLARILVAPQFLYRVGASGGAPAIRAAADAVAGQAAHRMGDGQPPQLFLCGLRFPTTNCGAPPRPAS